MGFFDDVGHAIGDAANAVGRAASDVVSDVEHAVDDAVHAVENAVPAELRHYIQGAGEAIKWLAREGNELAGDVKTAVDLVKKVDWASVVHDVEAAVSVVPVLGTAVSDIIATAEVAYEALTAKNPLEFAIRSAYTYALASVPGGDALRSVLDPAVDAVVRIALDREDPTSALLHSVVDEVPDAPKVLNLSPRTVAASLVKVVAAHRSVVDVGVDLAAEAAGTAGPVAERAVRAAAQAAQHGMTPAQAVNVALDIAPIPSAARAAWDDVRKAAKSLGANLLPEDLEALGAFATAGVQEAAEKMLGPVAADGGQAVERMLSQGRDYAHVVEVMGAAAGVDRRDVDRFVAHLPQDHFVSASDMASRAQHPGQAPGRIGLYVTPFPERLVEALVAAEPHRHIVLDVNLAGLTPLVALEALLEKA